MYRTAITASPFPYSKVCDTFRPRIGQSATIRADLGGETFVHFLEPHAMLNSLVHELRSERRPTGIKNRLCHTGSGQCCGVDVANDNIIEPAHKSGRALVQKISPTIGDFIVDRLDPSRFVRTLRYRQFGFGVAVNARRCDLIAVRQRGKIPQAQINANTTYWHPRHRLHNFQNDVQVPVASAVPGKIGSIRDFPVGQRARVKDAKGITRKSESVTLPFQFTPLQRNPAQRFTTPEAQIRPTRLATRFGILLADVINRPRMQTQFFATAGRESNQVKTRVPPAMETQSIFLPVIAVVPYEIDCPRLPIQQAGK
jgi:hypothetical protein